MTPKIRTIEVLNISLLDTDDKLSFVGIVDLQINDKAVSYINDVEISEIDARVGFVRHHYVDQELKSQLQIVDEEYNGLISAIHGLAEPGLADAWFGSREPLVA